MACFYEGTSLSEFKEMPLDELLIAQEHSKRIHEQREAEIEKRSK